MVFYYIITLWYILKIFLDFWLCVCGCVSRCGCASARGSVGSLRLWEVGATWHGCRKQTRVLDNSELALNHWVTSPVPCINGLGFRVFVSISEEMVWAFSHFCDRKTWTAAPRTFNSKGPFWPSEDTIPGGSGSVLGYHVSESSLRQLKGPWLISWLSIS